MNPKKGQAAMEYLMTYGWALVALVVVIAAIMATGAFNPSYLIAEECTLQPDLRCSGHVLYRDGDSVAFKMRVDNGLGYDILLKEIKITTSDGTEESYNLGNQKLPQGEREEITMGLDHIKKVQGEVERMRVSLNYVSCAPEVNYDCLSSGPEHTISGRIVARMEEKE